MLVLKKRKKLLSNRRIILVTPEDNLYPELMIVMNINEIENKLDCIYLQDYIKTKQKTSNGY